MKKYEFVYKDNEKVVSDYSNVVYYVEEEFNGFLDKYGQERVVNYIRL